MFNLMPGSSKGMSRSLMLSACRMTFPGQVVAALLEDMGHGLCAGVSVGVLEVGRVAVGAVALHEGPVFPHPRIVVPRRVARILETPTAITPVAISGPTGFITEVALADGAATKRSGSTRWPRPSSEPEQKNAEPRTA